MQLFQESGPSSMFDESFLQRRMKLNQLSKRIACLFAPVDEFLVTWKIVMRRTGPFAVDHLHTELLQPIPQLDIFHSIQEKIFIEAAGFLKKRSRRGNVSGVVIREIHRPGSNRVRIVDAAMPKISEKWIDGILPRRQDVSNNGRTWRLGVVIEVFLDQIRLSNDVVVDEQDNIADGLSQAGVA